jgi:hypothetical protein
MNIEKLKITEEERASIRYSGRGKGCKRSVSFLKGPVPMNWLKKAMKQPGASISIGLVLWYYKGLRKSNKFEIGITEIVEIIGCSRYTVHRGLFSLEKAGLISVQHHNGRKHVLTIITE